MPFSSQTRWAEAALLLTTLIWGSTFVLTKLALIYLPPLLYLAVRFTLAFLIMSILFFNHLRRSFAGSWRGGLVVGLALAISYVTQTIGMQTTDASKAAFITGLSVILVPIFNAFAKKRLPSWSVQVGALFAMAGLALLSGVIDTGLIITRGDMWVAVCAIAFAMHILTTGHYASKTNIPAMTTVQFAVVAVSCWITSLSQEHWPGPPPREVWWIILFLAAFATAGAFVMQTWAQKRLNANQAAIILTMEPVFATFFGFIVLGEKLSAAGYVGCLFVIGGTLIAEMGPALIRLRGGATTAETE